MTDVERIQTPSGGELVRRPSGTWTYVAGMQKRRVQPAQVLEVLSEPDTTCITFASGRTWLIKPLGKVDAASPAEAAAAYLDLVAAQ